MICIYEVCRGCLWHLLALDVAINGQWADRRMGALGVSVFHVALQVSYRFMARPLELASWSKEVDLGQLLAATS